MSTKKSIVTYSLISYGTIADINIETTKKSVINRTCKWLAKYGQNQSTTITTVKKTTKEVKTK